MVVEHMNSHSKWLREAAKEIAIAGHYGWGNTCTQAADEIDRLERQLTAAFLGMSREDSAAASQSTSGAVKT